MALTFIKVKIANPAALRRWAVEEFLVDSGAIFTVAPASLLRRLGIKPHGQETFTLADGTHVKRKIGSAFFEINGRKGASTIIFGQKGDVRLLGALTLEELGLMLDPLKRELRPLPLILA